MKRSILTAALVVAMGIGLAVPVGAAEPPPKRIIYLADHTDDTTWKVKRAVRLWNQQPYVRIVMVPDCAGYNPCRTVVDKYQDDYYVQWYPEFPTTIAGYYDDERQLIELFTWPILRPEISGYDAYARQIFRNAIACHEVGHYILKDSWPAQHTGLWKISCMSANFSGVDYPGVALKKVR